MSNLSISLDAQVTRPIAFSSMRVGDMFIPNDVRSSGTLHLGNLRVKIAADQYYNLVLPRVVEAESCDSPAWLLVDAKITLTLAAGQGQQS